MEVGLRALEVTGTIDEHQQLHLDQPLPVAGPNRARVIILIPEEMDFEEGDWLRAAARNPSFAFLAEPAEELYSLADGRPRRDEG